MATATQLGQQIVAITCHRVKNVKMMSSALQGIINMEHYYHCETSSWKEDHVGPGARVLHETGNCFVLTNHFNTVNSMTAH